MAGGLLSALGGVAKGIGDGLLLQYKEKRDDALLKKHRAEVLEDMQTQFGQQKEIASIQDANATKRAEQQNTFSTQDREDTQNFTGEQNALNRANTNANAGRNDNDIVRYEPDAATGLLVGLDRKGNSHPTTVKVAGMTKEDAIKLRQAASTQALAQLKGRKDEDGNELPYKEAEVKSAADALYREWTGAEKSSVPNSPLKQGGGPQMAFPTPAPAKTAVPGKPATFKPAGAATYKSADEVRSAVSAGRIDRKEAERILRDQFGFE